MGENGLAGLLRRAIEYLDEDRPIAHVAGDDPMQGPAIGRAQVSPLLDVVGAVEDAARCSALGMADRKAEAFKECLGTIRGGERPEIAEDKTDRCGHGALHREVAMEENLSVAEKSVKLKIQLH